MPTEVDSRMRSEQGELFLWYSDSKGSSSGDTITYSRPYVIYLGHVNKISETYNKSVTVIPLVTKGSSNSFPLDGGTSRSYSFNGTREQPAEGIDDSGTTRLDGALPEESSNRWDTIINKELKWSCKKWITELQKFIDRWQMKSDGCFVLFRPSDTNPYVKLGPKSEGFYKNMIHGYLKSIEFTYNADSNEQITYYLTMTVGTCRTTPFVGDEIIPPYTDGESVSLNDSYITISNKDRSQYYQIGTLTNEYVYETAGEEPVSYPTESAVEEYTIIGGQCQPFETISMTISKKKLSKIIGSTLGFFVEGMNVIEVNAVGAKRVFLLSSIRSTGNSAKSSNGKIKLQGRSLAYEYKKMAERTDEIVGTPFEIIKNILYSGNYGQSYSDKTFKYLIRNSSIFDPQEHPSKVLDFKVKAEGTETTIWDILQICAITLQARLFFIGDRAYLIDYTIPFNSISGATTNMDSNELHMYRTVSGEKAALYPYMDNLPNEGDNFLSQRIVGTCDYENQGIDTVTQFVTVNCTLPFTTVVEGGIVTTYNERATATAESVDVKAWNEAHGTPDENYGKIFDLPDLLEGLGDDGIPYTQGKDFAEGYIKYMVEPQQPVSFTVKESTDTGWQMLFPYVAQADSFLDETNDIGNMTNKSIYTNGELPQKFSLSLYEFHYPDMTTTYTWGRINDTDLPATIAKRF